MHDHGHDKTHAGDEQGYEESDMNVKLIGIAIVSLAILMFGGIVAAIVILRTLETRPAMNMDIPSPLAVDETWTVEGPTLQMDARKDRDVALAAELARLNSYGLTSDTEGMQRAHAPVEVGIELLLEKKVPYRQEPVVAAEAAEDDIWATEADAEADADVPQDAL